jgi:hypothetical protein
MCFVFHCYCLHFEHLKTIHMLCFLSQESESQYINELHALEPFFDQHGQEVPSLLWNPISVSQELVLGPYPEPDESTHITQFLDFKLLPCVKCNMFSFGCFPGV